MNGDGMGTQGGNVNSGTTSIENHGIEITHKTSIKIENFKPMHIL